jgi:exopolysaccharide production protein ExoZ
MQNSRQQSLDWLRGLMALSILLFHLGQYDHLSGPQASGSVIGRLGIYAVSIFFIVSGLSIAIAHDKYFDSINDIFNFYIRRIFRIWPLLWAVVFLVTLRSYLFATPSDPGIILLNITTLFGFFAPTKYINMGAWSIGNEMVYYALTPLFINSYRKSRFAGNMFAVISIIIGIIFSFFIINPEQSIQDQWYIYINPFNNLFFYVSGIAIFYNFANLPVSLKKNIIILGGAIAAFVIFPSGGNQITIVTGFNRIALSSIVILVVFCFYKFDHKLLYPVGFGLEQIGMATYGIYLLHPLVIETLPVFFRLYPPVNDLLFCLAVIVVTMALAHLSFKYFESPFVDFGKKLTKNLIRSH